MQIHGQILDLAISNSYAAQAAQKTDGLKRTADVRKKVMKITSASVLDVDSPQFGGLLVEQLSGEGSGGAGVSSHKRPDQVSGNSDPEVEARQLSFWA